MESGDGQTPLGHRGPVVSRAQRVDCSLLGAFQSVSTPRVAWFAPDEPSAVGWGAAATIQTDGPDRFATVREQATQLFEGMMITSPSSGPVPPVAQPRLFGGFSFYDNHEANPPWQGFPAANFVLPRVQLVETPEETWLTVTSTDRDSTDEQALESAIDEIVAQATGTAELGPVPGLEDIERTPSYDEWCDQVKHALTQIAMGELEKVVLAQTLTASFSGEFALTDTLQRLGEAYPGCYRFAIDPGRGSSFLGATPERLISRQGNHIETEALAGSMGRGEDQNEDNQLARALVDSPKVRHEHDLVVQAIRGKLEEYADSVTVDGASVHQLPNVQHLDTPLSATLREATHVVSLAEALHPTPAVGGLPPGTASRLIAETEQFDRGWYAAPVGWFDADENGTFAVGIRSGVATDSTITLFAGNGIVLDSEPDEEWSELQLKYSPMLDQLR